MDERSTRTSVDETAGASPNERLLYSAKQDLEDLFVEVEEGGGYDINFKDGLGNTALHYAVMNLSPNVMELILEQEGADVDLINKQGQTPLHAAVEIQDSKPRLLITKSLLEAGADPRIRNSKTGQKPIETLMSKIGPGNDGASRWDSADEELVKLFKNAEAEIELDPQDVVDDVDEDDQAGGIDSDDVASD